jgi:hypothetical protein
MLEMTLLSMEETADVAMALKAITATRQENEYGGKLPLEAYTSGVVLWKDFFTSTAATMAHIRATGRWRVFVDELTQVAGQ